MGTCLVLIYSINNLLLTLTYTIAWSYDKELVHITIHSTPAQVLANTQPTLRLHVHWEQRH